MNILLDTCTILWLQLEPSRVPATLCQILLKPETRRYSSAAAAWEIAIKWSLGKLPSRYRLMNSCAGFEPSHW